MSDKEIIEKLKGELVKRDVTIKAYKEVCDTLIDRYNALGRAYKEIADELDEHIRNESAFYG